MPLTGEATPLLARDSKGDRSNNRRSWRFAALTTSAVAIVLATVLLSTTSSPISSVLGLGRASLGQNATNVTMSSTDNVRR
jgi:phosphate/sulfate permease